jgi:hypothetical protein
MHERKVEMAKRVEGFIGLPGGFGTFEEVCYELLDCIVDFMNILQVLEVTTWTQLGIHDKRMCPYQTFLFFVLISIF